ncbi:MAG: glycosyltransferase family 4 protein, partial [Gemmatimonadales bacterium]
LEAVALLRDEGRWPAGWIVAIAGRKGEEEDRLRRRSSDPVLTAIVRVLGHRDDVPDLLAAADLYAMPSLSEGMPLALLEAMHAGLAIVASEVGGVPEAVRDGREGLLVPPADARRLADALARVLGDDALRLRLGQAAQERAGAHYSADAMTAAYEQLYHHSLARSGRRRVVNSAAQQR